MHTDPNWFMNEVVLRATVSLGHTNLISCPRFVSENLNSLLMHKKQNSLGWACMRECKDYKSGLAIPSLLSSTPAKILLIADD